MSECDASFEECTPWWKFTPSAGSDLSSSSWAALDGLKGQQAAFADCEQMQAGMCAGVVFCMPAAEPWEAGDAWLHEEPWATPLWGTDCDRAAPPWGAYCDSFSGVPPSGAEMSEGHAAPPPPRTPRSHKEAAARPPASGGDEPAEPSDPMPVRHTFIHFDTDGRGPAGHADAEPAAGSTVRSASAPPSLLRRAFRLRDPRRDEAHRIGDCKPCAYYLYKEDGCRWGDECSFCHLCVEGEVKKRKKEKNRLMKMQARCTRPRRQCR